MIPTDFEVETLMLYLELQWEIASRAFWSGFMLQLPSDSGTDTEVVSILTMPDRRFVKAIDLRRQCREIYGKKQRTRDRALWDIKGKSHAL